jgi:signal transduction histidine kinase/DNA-binding response OmpR family regulator
MPDRAESRGRGGAGPGGLAPQGGALVRRNVSPEAGTSAAGWPTGGGDMGRRVRGLDWTRTPLGPPELWPASLRGAARTVLDAGFPMWLAWGPELVLLYNDACAPLLGARHPGALGRSAAEPWADVWDDVHPLIERARAGAAGLAQDRLLAFSRDGVPEERYFTFSFGPVCGDDGRTAGLLCPVIETTDRVLGERRARTLAELSALAHEQHGARARTPERACHAAAEVLARNRHDLPFALVYLIEAAAAPRGPRVARLAGAVGLLPGDPAVPQVVPLLPASDAATGWPLAAAAATAHPQPADDLGRRFGDLPGGPWPQPATRALVVPVARPDSLEIVALLVAGTSARRPLDQGYREFLAQLARPLGGLLAGAGAHAHAHAGTPLAGRARTGGDPEDAASALLARVSQQLSTPLTLILGPTEEALVSGRGLRGHALKAVYRNQLRLLEVVDALVASAAGAGTGTGTPVGPVRPLLPPPAAGAGAQPRAPAPLADEATPAPDPDADVLIVEADPDMRGYLTRLVQTRWRADGAGDVTAAVARARRRPPDVVLAGLGGEGAGDAGLLPALREDPRLRDAAIIAITARADEPPSPAGAPGAADDYLVTPFSARELLARVDIQVRMRRLRAEADAERQLLYALFAQAPFVASIYEGPELRLMFQNDAARRLYRRPEALGKPLAEGAPEPERRPELEDIERVFRTGQPAVERLYRVRPPGGRGDADERYLLTSLQALRDEVGQVDRVMSVAVDVTDQVLSARKVEAARAEAEAASRSKDQFLAMLSHELRNPLTPILATTQLMRLEGGRKFAREREVIERQARQLCRLVDDLLDVARIARGKAQLERKPVELGAIVQRAVEVAGPLLEARGHRLEVDVAPGLVLDADEGRLVQVVSNLLTNAARYTPPRGSIQVRGARDGDAALLRVLDNGIGLRPELLPRMFQRFAQGAAGAPEDAAGPHADGGGLGLGLSIAQSLVELHGGTVAASSAGLGKGSEFTVRLPLLPPSRLPRAPRPAAPAAATTRPAPGGRTVLIVDDNRDIADVLARMLRKRGHTVQVCYDAARALEVIDRFRPRFALLDIHLPATDGYELAARLRRRIPGLVMLAVTGYGQLSDRRRARRAGFAEHLTKPIDLARLIGIIESEKGPGAPAKGTPAKGPARQSRTPPTRK